MDKQAQQNFAPRLWKLRTRFISQVNSAEESLREDILAPGGHTASRMHPGDQDSEGLDEQLAIAANEEFLLEEVEAALERIEAGTFGICEDCQRPISRERLKAIPYTPHCIQCAQQQDEAAS